MTAREEGLVGPQGFRPLPAPPCADDAPLGGSRGPTLLVHFFIIFDILRKDPLWTSLDRPSLPQRRQGPAQAAPEDPEGIPEVAPGVPQRPLGSPGTVWGPPKDPTRIPGAYPNEPLNDPQNSTGNPRNPPEDPWGPQRLPRTH